MTVVSAIKLAVALLPHLGSGAMRYEVAFEPESQDFYRNWDKLSGWRARRHTADCRRDSYYLGVPQPGITCPGYSQMAAAGSDE